MSASSLLLAEPAPNGAETEPAVIGDTGNTIVVKAKKYSWRWSQNTDVFCLEDKQGRLITEGSLQPAVLVKDSGDGVQRRSAGRFLSKSVKGNRPTVTYEGVNEESKVMIAWRFDDDGLWFEPVVYETGSAEDVVALHYFAKASAQEINPTLRYSYLIQPGLSESSVLSPIVPALNGFNMTTWLGHGGGGVTGTFQQWGLPTHYFCVAVSEPAYNSRASLKEHLSDTVCCGLADLPAGDLLFQLKGGGSEGGTIHKAWHRPFGRRRSDYSARHGQDISNG